MTENQLKVAIEVSKKIELAAKDAENFIQSHGYEFHKGCSITDAIKYLLQNSSSTLTAISPHDMASAISMVTTDSHIVIDYNKRKIAELKKAIKMFEDENERLTQSMAACII